MNSLPLMRSTEPTGPFVSHADVIRAFLEEMRATVVAQMA